MGLTSTGYQRRTYDNILNDKIAKAREIFGEDIDVSDLTPLGKFIRLNAYDQANAEEECEAVYYSRFPNTATGKSLDRLLPFASITRNNAKASTYSVLFTGYAGYTINAGTLVATDTGLEFYTVGNYTISEDGNCNATVCCTQAGAIGNVNASSINKIVNPDVNITSVLGISALSPGTDEESDVDLRKRFNGAISGSGSCNANAIHSALLRIPTVQFVAVVENDEDTEDEDGRPPHSFECYVMGGDDYKQEIADAIFEKRPIGIKTVGDVSVTITDVSGNENVVRYSMALNVSITVRAQIVTDATFPADGVENIQNSVINYINSLGIGKSLALTSLYGYIHKVKGVTEVTDLKLSTDGGSTYSSSNVQVPKYGVAICSGVNVEVVQ